MEKVQGAALVETELISIYKKRIQFLLCVIDIFSKYVGVIGFQIFLNNSHYKPNKTWVNRGREYCNKSIKLWLKDKSTTINSEHKEEKLAVAA